MSDIPLHPFIVHFPMVLAFFLPLAALASLVAGLRSGKGRKYWGGVILINALLLGSSFLAVHSGERDEEKVEEVLASKIPLEIHANKAEFFLEMTGVALIVSALGLAPGAIGLSGRIMGGLASLLILFLGIQVGHTGGQLIYKHGAASAFVVDNATRDNPGDSPAIRTGKEKDDD